MYVPHHVVCRGDVGVIPVVPSVDWSHVSNLIQPVELLLEAQLEDFNLGYFLMVGYCGLLPQGKQLNV